MMICNEINNHQKKIQLKYDDPSLNTESFLDKLNDELNDFHNNLIMSTSENEELKKIQELILYLQCSKKDQVSQIKCTYHIGEMIENIQYLKTTNSIYDVGMIFDLFVKVSSNLSEKSNFDYLLKVYSEIQKLIDSVLLTPNKQIEVTLLNFSENKNYILKIILLLETSKVANHYKKILSEQKMIHAIKKIHNPNPLVNLVAIKEFYKKQPISTKLNLFKICEVDFIKTPSSLINLFNLNIPQNSSREYFFIK